MSKHICLVPRCTRKATNHHWPIKKSDGGVATVPMCRYHHDIVHAKDYSKRDALNNVIMSEAPVHWARRNLTEAYSKDYNTWLVARGDKEPWVLDLYGLRDTDTRLALGKSKSERKRNTKCLPSR